MGDKKKVLVTGMSGRVADVIRKHLGDTYELSGLDLVAAKGVPCTVADIADLDAIQPAFEGIDAVIHLGASPKPRDPWEDVLNSNLIGTRNVYEAARVAGVKRVIFASSHHAAGYYPAKAEPYTTIYEGRIGEVRRPFRKLTPNDIRPSSYYGVSKAYGEALGSYFHDAFGLSIICLRIGWLTAPDDPTFSPAALSLYLSHRDAAQLFQKSVDAPVSVGFTVVNAVSDNTLSIWDIEETKRVLGYEPQDNAGEDWTPDPNAPPVM